MKLEFYAGFFITMFAFVCFICWRKLERKIIVWKYNDSKPWSQIAVIACIVLFVYYIIQLFK